MVNPEFNDGLTGWTLSGDAKIEHNVANDGNKFIVASKRKGPYHGFSQEFQLEKDKFYVISGTTLNNYKRELYIHILYIRLINF